MRGKSKVLLLVVVGALAVIGIGLYQLLTNLDSIVARVIEEKGSEATGTQVSVEGVTIELRKGTGTIAGLEVANPQPFSDRPAIAFREIRIGIDPAAAMSTPVVIREVTVTGASVLLEQTTDGNNLRTLQRSLQQPAASESETDDGPRVVIEQFVLQDAAVEVQVPQLAESRDASISRIELRGIGRETNGATAASAAKQIIEPIVRAALESAAAEGIGNQLRQEADKAKKEITDKLLDRLPLPDAEDDAEDRD